MPLNADSIDTDAEDVGADTVIAADAARSQKAPRITRPRTTPTEVALSEPAEPIVSDKSDAATDQIADVLAALPPGHLQRPKAPVAIDYSGAGRRRGGRLCLRRNEDQAHGQP